ncbi:sensor histidine kinase [Diplocloster hominis]|uniref:sensor histidine kinase n=1 Tax=Diplocloster hominis TaxID=3079010 RepID=UPI0031BA4179
MNEQDCRGALESLKQTKSGIVNFIMDIENISLDMAMNPEVKKAITADPTDLIRQADAQFQIEFGVKTRSYIRNVSIFTKDRIICQAGDHVVREDVGMVPEMTSMEGRTIWQSEFQGETNVYGAPYQKMYMYRAIRDPDCHTDTSPLAYERFTVDEAAFRKLYSGIAETAGTIYVLDHNGKVMSSSRGDMIGLDFPLLPEPDLSGREGYLIRRKQVAAYYTIEQAGLLVVKIDPANQVLRSSASVNQAFMMCFLFILIFAAAFLVFERRTILIPLGKLSYAVSIEWNDEFEIPAVDDSRGEIGQLNAALIEMVDYIKRLIRDQYKMNIASKEAQLRLIQNQINPHFLYGALDCVRQMAEKSENQDIVEQVDALDDIFRQALNSGAELTTVSSEVEHLKSYLLIQKNRFGDRINIEIQVEEELKQYPVLRLILQPLVENACIHGLEKKRRGGIIRIAIYRDQQVIVYVVEDNGAGADEERIRRYLTREGDREEAFALCNIDERVKLRFGDRYGLTFCSQVDVGTRVEVRFPYEEN